MEEEQKPKSTREKAQELAAQGLTGKAIAELLHVTPGRISQLIGKRRPKPETPQ